MKFSSLVLSVLFANHATAVKILAQAPDCMNDSMCDATDATREVCLKATKFADGSVFDTRCGPKDKCGNTIDSDTAYLHCDSAPFMDPVGPAAAGPTGPPPTDGPSGGRKEGIRINLGPITVEEI